MTKVIIIVLFVAMVISLGIGLYHLLKTPDETDKGDKVVKSLTWRIGIWVVLFAFIMISIQMEWLKPSNSVHPINFNKEQQKRIEQDESRLQD